MKRRQWLAVSGVLAGSVAGCTGLGRTVELTPEEPPEDSTNLGFYDANEERFRLQVIQQGPDDPEAAFYRFFMATWQPDGTRVDSLTLRFRSPPTSSGYNPAGISLNEGAHADRATIYQEDEDPSTTVIELADTTDIGRGSVRVDCVLEGDREDGPQQLWIGTEATCSADGLLETTYRASGALTVTFP